MTALVPKLAVRRRGAAPPRTLISMAVALALAQYGSAVAGPAGAQVVAGQVAVVQPDARHTLVTQGSATAIVNWQQFSIGPSDSVEFRQPGTASVILNRVTGSNPSEIYGRLSANGQVFLVNPGGVLFGRTAQVSVGGLVASTLDIGNDDFLSGRYRFAAGPAGASVDNQGQLHAAQGGTIALLGARVNNDGTISARLGTAALAAGDKMTLDFSGDGLTKFRVDKGAVEALVTNRGMLIADGGQAILSAHAATALTETVLDQQGVVRARSLVERNGRIVLDGGAQGTTLAAGTLDVSGREPGRRGGSVAVLGHQVGVLGEALLDARGDAGGGTILVGGDYQGANPLVRNADATFVGPAAQLRADAGGAGDGGKVIVWSGQATRVFGAVSANGGAQGGNGGFIETSGKFLDVAGARIGASAPRGKGGQWLLDPYSVSIDTQDSLTDVSAGPNFSSTGPSAQIWYQFIVDALNAGTSVSVTTGGGASGEGDINVNAPIVKTSGGDVTLTLNAARDINVAAEVRIASSAVAGKLDVDFNADADAANGGAITMNPGSSIGTNGGNLRFYGASDPQAGRARGASRDRPDGVLLSGASIDTTALNGSGPGGAVSIRGAGTMFAQGSGSDLNYTYGAGVNLSLGRIRTTSGAIAIDGVGSAGGNGVMQASYEISTTGGGAIDLRGRGGAAGPSASGAGGAGILFNDNTTVFTSGGPGPIVISGEAVGTAGISMVSSTAIGRPDTSGNITLRAFNVAAGPVRPDMIQLAGTIQSSGVLNLRPGGVSPAGALTDAPGVAIDLFASTNNFSLDADELTQVIQPRFAALVVGSATHTGRIGVSAGSFPGAAITLQNGGPGSLGIALEGGLSNPGGALTLSSGGAVTQGGPIVADSLLLHGARPESNFQLDNALNAVGRLSARFDLPATTGGSAAGDVNFVNSGDLTFGRAAGTVMGAGGNLPLTLDVVDAVIGGDLTARAGRDLILTQRIGTLTGDMTLIAGRVLNNAANAALTPAGGKTWRVFADTWIGEQAGGLAGSAPNPNIYNCAADAACTVALPQAGNHFIYRQQPRVSIVPDPVTRVRTYGSANPVFSFVQTGFVKGDVPASAVTGGYLTAATAASDVGLYPVTPDFVSPAGYLIDAAPGSLRIDPATLTYLATPATRFAGSPNPSLGGSVSGLVAGDTLGSATTGSLVFATQSAAETPPGRYPINGSGLAARNYVFVQALPNATALTIEPPP
ncbi:MAG TPA: MBG domain-containing protein, partial [Telluria sp.]